MARRRISGVKLAEQIGRTQPYFSRRLNGEIAFDLDDLERIADVLDIAVTDLLPQSVRNSPTLRYRTSHERSRKRQTARPPLPRTPVVGRPVHEPHQPNGRPQPDLSPQPLRRPAIRRRRAMA